MSGLSFGGIVIIDRPPVGCLVSPYGGWRSRFVSDREYHATSIDCHAGSPFMLECAWLACAFVWLAILGNGRRWDRYCSNNRNAVLVPDCQPPKHGVDVGIRLPDRERTPCSGARIRLLGLALQQPAGYELVFHHLLPLRRSLLSREPLTAPVVGLQRCDAAPAFMAKFDADNRLTSHFLSLLMFFTPCSSRRLPWELRLSGCGFCVLSALIMPSVGLFSRHCHASSRKRVER